MPNRRTTFSKFIIQDQRRRGDTDPELTALLNDVQTACKYIASAVARGTLRADATPPDRGENRSLETIASEIMLREIEFGGTTCGMLSSRDGIVPIPDPHPRGRYLIAFQPLDGSANLDVNLPAGTIFSISRAPEGCTDPVAADFLRAGTQQLAAGFALYGSASMIVLTIGDGVHGFTLDREIGAFILTHPQMRIPAGTREFAINASNARHWEPPVKHYVEECIAGKSGVRGQDFTMRWVATLVAEVYRILVRGGLFMYPRDTQDPAREGHLHLLYEAGPMAFVVEQAGGAASTGRARVLDVEPTSVTQRVPLIFGSKDEVERLERYHLAHDRGEALAFEAPLFKDRSLFRNVAP